jgi:hypothetical protein
MDDAYDCQIIDNDLKKERADVPKKQNEENVRNPILKSIKM